MNSNLFGILAIGRQGRLQYKILNDEKNSGADTASNIKLGQLVYPMLFINSNKGNSRQYAQIA